MPQLSMKQLASTLAVPLYTRLISRQGRFSPLATLPRRFPQSRRGLPTQNMYKGGLRTSLQRVVEAGGGGFKAAAEL